LSLRLAGLLLRTHKVVRLLHQVLHIWNSAHLLVRQLGLCAHNGATTPRVRLINLDEQLVVKLGSVAAFANL